MSKVVYAKDILGCDIRTRNKVIALRSALNDSDCEEIDMTGITFVSRSFADELLNVKLEFGVEITHAAGEVLTMISIVDKGRKSMTARKHETEGEVIKIENMQELEKYFATM